MEFAETRLLVQVGWNAAGNETAMAGAGRAGVPLLPRERP